MTEKKQDQSISDLDSLKAKMLRGGAWSLIGQFSSIFVTLITNICLARILGPDEFGLMGIILFFISIANIITESGLSGALIRKTNSTENDYSTVFVFNIVLSIIGVVIISIISPYISIFYNFPQLQKPLIVSSLVLLLRASTFTQNTKLIANLEYKKYTAYDITSCIIGSSISIILAYRGAGVWALVFLYIIRYTIHLILLYSFEGIPSISFNKSSFLNLYKFGLFTTLSSVLNVGFSNIYQLVLGKIDSLSETGFYYQAQRIDQISTSLLSNINQGVLFSGLSKIQNDQVKFHSIYINISRLIFSIYGLFLVLLFCYSELVITTLLGVQWLQSALYLKFMCCTSFFLMQENYNRILFKVYNKTERILKIEIIRGILQIIGLSIGVYYKDIIMLMFFSVVVSIISYIYTTYLSYRLVGQLAWTQFLSTCKIVSIMVVSIVVSLIIVHLLKIAPTSYYTLLLAPILISIMLLFLHLFQIINIKTMAHSIKLNIKSIS